MNRTTSSTLVVPHGASLSRRRTSTIFTGFLAIGLSLALSGCDLAVVLPGAIEESELGAPTEIPLLVGSVQGVFECAYQQYVMLSGKVGDEWMSSGSDGSFYIYDQRTITPGTGTYGGGGCPGGQIAGLYTPLSQARWFADDALGRLAEVTAQEVPAKVQLEAIAASVAGYSFVLFGEGFCSAAFDNGPELSPPAVLALAEDRFTTAIARAEAAGATELLNLAYLGRARARLNLGRLSEAASDARQVADGFAYYATRSGVENSRENKLYRSNYLDRNIQIAPGFWNLEWEGVPDPRVALNITGNFGRDGTVPEVLQTKYTSFSSPIPIGRYEEALLIIAEAEGGDTAVDIINELHARAGLPPFASDDADEIMQQVYEERRRELFLEGHRLNDMLRLGLPFPSGVNPYNNRTYGETTCFPLPDIERDNNPSLSG